MWLVTQSQESMIWDPRTSNQHLKMGCHDQAVSSFDPIGRFLACRPRLAEQVWQVARTARSATGSVGREKTAFEVGFKIIMNLS